MSDEVTTEVAQFGLQVVGQYEGDTGTYYHLNCKSSVKARLLPGAALYVCLNSKCIAARNANDCEHCAFVAKHELTHARAAEAATP